MIRRRENVKIGITSGITILEILVVLGIIALIAAIAAPRVIAYLGRAKSEAAHLQIQNLSNAVQLLYIDMGRHPSVSEGLSALVQAPAGAEGWFGPYITSDTGLTDPWGRDYIYEVKDNENGFSIRSLGRDGREGGSGEDADLSF